MLGSFWAHRLFSCCFVFIFCNKWFMFCFYFVYFFELLCPSGISLPSMVFWCVVKCFVNYCYLNTFEKVYIQEGLKRYIPWPNVISETCQFSKFICIFLDQNQNLSDLKIYGSDTRKAYLKKFTYHNNTEPQFLPGESFVV